MKRSFCFLCGKETENLKEGYCEECYFDKVVKFDVPEKLEFITCSKCNKTKVGNKWVEKDLEDLIKDKIKKDDINITKKDLKRFIVSYETSSGKKIDHMMNVHQVRIACPICSRMMGGYYESIIQLRCNDIERFTKIVERELRKSTHPKSFYTVKENRGGLDFYVGSKSVANTVGETFRNKYNAEITKSFKIVTKREGKDVVRTIILIRL